MELLREWTILLALGNIRINTGVARVESASITTTTTNQDAILGSNVVSVTCTYTLEPNEDFLSMRIFRAQSPGSNEELALFQGNSGIYSISDQGFKDRTNLTFTASYAAITFHDIECGDNRKYQCEMAYTIGSKTVTAEATMNLNVQAKSEQPDFFPSNFATSLRVEGDVLHIECRGRVGKPAGNYIWFGYLSTGEQLDLTSHAVLDDPYGPITTDCYYQRISTLRYNLTRRDNGIVIRCTANQTLLGPPPTVSDFCNSSFCRQSDAVEVEYPVKDSDMIVRTVPEYNKYIPGSNVTFICLVNGNPAPKYVWRQRTGDILRPGNIVRSTQKEWKIEKLQLGDSGRYTCEATNTVRGVVYRVLMNAYIRLAFFNWEDFLLSQEWNTRTSVTPDQSINLTITTTCSKPAPKFTWKYRLSSSGSFSNLIYGTSNTSSPVCYLDNKEYTNTLTLPGNTVSFYNKTITLRLEVEHVSFDPNENYIKYRDSQSIQFPVSVSSVRLSPVGKMNVFEGGSVTFLCKTSQSFPKATVTWHKGGTQLPETSSSTSPSSGVLAVTTSQLTYVATINDQGQKIFCRASNSATKSVVQSNSAELNIFSIDDQPTASPQLVLGLGIFLGLALLVIIALTAVVIKMYRDKSSGNTTGTKETEHPSGSPYT